MGNSLDDDIRKFECDVANLTPSCQLEAFVTLAKRVTTNNRILEDEFHRDTLKVIDGLVIRECFKKPSQKNEKADIAALGKDGKIRPYQFYLEFGEQTRYFTSPLRNLLDSLPEEVLYSTISEAMLEARDGRIRTRGKRQPPKKEWNPKDITRAAEILQKKGYNTASTNPKPRPRQTQPWRCARANSAPAAENEDEDNSMPIEDGRGDFGPPLDDHPDSEAGSLGEYCGNYPSPSESGIFEAFDAPSPKPWSVIPPSNVEAADHDVVVGPNLPSVEDVRECSTILSSLHNAGETASKGRSALCVSENGVDKKSVELLPPELDVSERSANVELQNVRENATTLTSAPCYVSVGTNPIPTPVKHDTLNFAAISKKRPRHTLRSAASSPAKRRKHSYPPQSIESPNEPIGLSSDSENEAGDPDRATENTKIFTRVQPGKWVCDEVIMQLLNCFIPTSANWLLLSPFFVRTSDEEQRRRSLRSLPPLQGLILPINLNNSHWVLGMVRPSVMEVEIYEPLGNVHHLQRCRKLLDEYLIPILDSNYVGCEVPVNAAREWNYSYPSAPVQADEYNCAIFCVVYVVCRTNNKAPPSKINPDVCRRLFKAALRAYLDMESPECSLLEQDSLEPQSNIPTPPVLPGIATSINAAAHQMLKTLDYFLEARKLKQSTLDVTLSTYSLLESIALELEHTEKVAFRKLRKQLEIHEPGFKSKLKKSKKLAAFCAMRECITNDKGRCETESREMKESIQGFIPLWEQVRDKYLNEAL